MCILLNVKKHEKTFALNVDIFNCIKIPQNFVDKSIYPMYNKSVCESTHRRRLVFSTQHIA